MSTAATYRRYPLGLPAGSVRSLLSLMIVGLLCGLVLLSKPDDVIPIPPYLIYLLFLIIGSFFAAHGNSINRADANESPPLGLPRGTVRLLLLAGIIATVAYALTQQPEAWHAQVEATVDKIKGQPYLPLVILGGFFVGVFIRAIMGRDNQPVVYQDIIAWVSLIATVGLVVAILVMTVINPNLREQAPIDLSQFEAGLGAVIAFYFAARS